MNSNKKGPIIDSGSCRCCGATKRCRLLNVEYDWSGQKEIYSDMFLDCFGLLLSHLDGEAEERLICATCVLRLRDASLFRRQVLLCEETLLKSRMTTVTENDIELKVDIEVKKETSDHCILEESNNNDCLYSDNDNDNNTSDGHMDCGSNEDMKIKHESTNKVKELPKLGLRSKETVRKPGRKRMSLKDVKVKREMLMNLKYMKQKLLMMKKNNLQIKQPIVKLVKMKPYIDKDYNSLQNAITIVKNSFVCPFFTIYGDYHCMYCREMFTDPSELRVHTLKHDPATYKDVVESKKNLLIDIDRIDCRLCPTNIDNIDSLKTHLTTAHGQKIHKETSNEFLKFKLKLGLLSCTECGLSCNSFQALKRHLAVHFGSFICEECGTHYFEERLLTFHKKRAHNTDSNKHEDYVCDRCGKNFRSKKGKSYHVAKIHEKEPVFACNKCDEVFLSYHLKYKHKMEEHGEKRSFPCSSCDKIYNNRKALREHNRKNHLQLLKHKCPLCDRRFYVPSELKDHMTSHTGERNYRCEYCGKTYPRLKALKVHMESHNTEKKYKCGLCTASYTQLNNYKNHVKSKHPVGTNSSAYV